MEIKIIASMFEDLKKLINSKFENININQSSNVPQVNQENEKDISEINEKMSKIRYFVEETSKCILHSNLRLIKSIDTFTDDGSDKLNKVANTLDKFTKDINRFQKASDRPQRHTHTIDIESSKGFIILIVFMLLFLLSFLVNYYQFKENDRLRDNDI